MSRSNRMSKNRAQSLYNAMGRELQHQSDVGVIRGKLDLAIAELEALHRHVDPKCKDQGPATCPTWEAIHGLRSLLPKA